MFRAESWLTVKKLPLEDISRILTGQDQDQDQDSLLVKRRNDNHSPGSVIRELVHSSHQRSDLATQSFASSADEIRESGRAFQYLIVWGKKLPL